MRICVCPRPIEMLHLIPGSKRCLQGLRRKAGLLRRMTTRCALGSEDRAAGRLCRLQLRLPAVVGAQMKDQMVRCQRAMQMVFVAVDLLLKLHVAIDRDAVRVAVRVKVDDSLRGRCRLFAASADFA